MLIVYMHWTNEHGGHIFIGAKPKEALMFVVFGASGHTGSVVASTLLERGKKVRVVARDASKVGRLEVS